MGVKLLQTNCVIEFECQKIYEHGKSSVQFSIPIPIGKEIKHPSLFYLVFIDKYLFSDDFMRTCSLRTRKRGPFIK